MENENSSTEVNKNLITRVINIITKPQQEWTVIATEQTDNTKLTMGYILPLVLIPAIAVVLSYGLIGVGYGYLRHSWSWGIGAGISTIVSSFMGVFITAIIVNALAPNFGSQKNFGRALQLVAYSMTPMWIAGILNIFPVLSILVFLVGLYGIYLMYLGMPHTMQTPKDKLIGYLVVSILSMIVVTAIFMFIFTAIASAIFVTSLGGGLIF